MARHKIAVIPGDGIGKEVVPEGLRVLDAAARRFGIELQLDHFDWSCDYYARHGSMMPSSWKELIGQHDALFFGAVGWPATVPDHVSLWGMLIKFGREFDQYVTLRPCRLMPGIRTPLADRKPGDIDFFVGRENTEGEYSRVGGRMYEGTEREVVFQQACFSRKGVDRILKFAFELARKRPKKHLTSATKSNGISITMPYWDERVEAMAKQYPDIRWDKFHIDILTAHFVAHPDWFDVVVASNLFGDILSDLGPACTGTIGIAPDRKSTRLNSSHLVISYAVFCLKKKNTKPQLTLQLQLVTGPAPVAVTMAAVLVALLHVTMCRIPADVVAIQTMTTRRCTQRLMT